jgi:hypothetical protein
MVVFHEWRSTRSGAAAKSVGRSVGEELSCGGDLATNVGRFLRELQQSKVLFTAEGRPVQGLAEAHRRHAAAGAGRVPERRSTLLELSIASACIAG